MRTTWARRSLPGLAVALVVVTAGCSAGGSAPDSSAAGPTPTPAVVVPAGAVSLADLGFSHGPVQRVFVPLDARVGARVDQTNNVTLVVSAPPAAELDAFLRRTLPGNGFTLTADDPAATTLTFAGFGWTGTFTGDTQASALLLRPAA